MALRPPPSRKAGWPGRIAVALGLVLEASTHTDRTHTQVRGYRKMFASRLLRRVASPPFAALAGAPRPKWTAATFRPPPPPPPPPGPKDRLVVLFPRQGSRQTTIEVKRRVLRSTPHMGGRRLKELVRKHARKGNMNSFIADFESRLDRVLYRCNAVPSIFAARMAIGHKHVLVNGRVANSTHTVLDPGDVVEPRPGSLHIFKRMMRRRLANNNFVFQKDAAPSPPKVAEAPVQSAVTADIEALLRDAAEVVASYRRLPPPRAPSQRTLLSASTAAPTRARATRQSQLDEIVPALVAGLAGDGSRLASEVASGRSWRARSRHQDSARRRSRGAPRRSPSMGAPRPPSRCLPSTAAPSAARYWGCSR